ncbi:MAG TPA: SDR family oxidoreductase [Chloroflexota bacterium]|nr:SDR family oxidoreductase [Chloroflexota bacterium]
MSVQATSDAMTDPVSLAGQVAIVTGAGQGLGQFVAKAFAHAGASVVAVGRTPEKLDETVSAIGATGGRAFAYPADVTDRSAIERLVEQVEREIGFVDILVNNAAVVTPLGPPWEVDPDEWWRTFEINVRGPFLCARAVLPRMIPRGRGRIVNVVSGAAQGMHPHASAYANSKAALAQFTRSLATAAKAHGIIAFAANPGTMTTETGMQQTLTWSTVGQQYYPTLGQLHEEGRGIPPERSAQLILSLASGRADSLSGRFISVNDDLDDLIRRAEEIQRDNHYVLAIRK